MRILLAFVPEWRYARQPYLALPYLASYLKSLGHDVRCMDCNMDFIEYLARGGIKQVHKKALNVCGLKGGLSTFIHQSSVKGNSLLSDVTWIAATHVSWLEKRLYEALILLRDQASMSDLHGHQLASITLDKVWNAVHSLSSPDSDGSAAVSPDYQCHSWELLLASAQSFNNPYCEFMDDCAGKIIDFNPDVVGISVASSVQIVPAITLALAIRRLKKYVVVLGGNVVTRLLPNKKALKCLLTLFDSMVYGEGEMAMAGIIKRVSLHQSLAGIPGTVSLDKDSPVVHSHESVVDISQSPLPDFSNFPLHSYICAKIHLPLLAGRGCYWRKCNFCAHHKGYLRYRVRPVESIISDMQRLSDLHDTSVFTFEDDDLSPGMLHTLSSALYGKPFIWGCYTRLEKNFTDSLCRQMADAGCRHLFFGLESGCQSTLNRMQKGIILDRVPSILHACQKAGIFVYLSLQFGYPGETKEEARQTLKFIKEYHELIDGISCQPFRLEGLSPLAHNPAKYDITLLPYPDNELTIYPPFETRYAVLNSEQISALTDEVAHYIAVQHDSFLLNRFPAYYAYFCTRDRLKKWFTENQEAKQRDMALLGLGLRPALPSGDFIVCTTDGKKIVFDWSTGTVLFPDNKMARMLSSSQPRVMKIPAKFQHLFKPQGWLPSQPKTRKAGDHL